MANKEHIWVTGTLRNGTEFKITSKSETDRSAYFGYIKETEKWIKSVQGENPLEIEDKMNKKGGIK